MLRRTLAFALLSALALLLSRADAAWPPPFDDTGVDYSDPKNWPTDPGFAGQWDFWSFVPSTLVGQVDEVTKRLGTGQHMDRAYAKTIGDRRVIIAVLDSGIRWDSGDTVNKYYLNAAELPVSSCPPSPGANDHDVNGDGIFNVQDYTTATGHELPAADKLCDPRVTDINKNGIVDPQDLIAVFSDGTDADLNGYIDDISGWDFFKNDNDANDEVNFGHGTGESRDSAAEGNDGRGDIGVCPECSVLMLRVADSFVAEVNSFAMATIYAVDNGAMVVQEALGTLDNSPLSLHALDYAYENDVTVIASAADENSYHHNFPGTNNHAIYVHAIRYDSERLENATTFFNFNNCTNYGAQLVLSIGGMGCSSEATGKGAGMAGLIYSAALGADVPRPRTTVGDPSGNRRLTADEVKQLFVQYVDSFYNPDDALNPLKFPTKQGWARRFGYGRPNMRKTVDAIFAHKLPVEVDLTAPNHFDVLYPEQTPKVPVIGRVGLRGQAANPPGLTFDYVVEWAPGIDPDDSLFKAIGQATMQSSAVAGELASWDISGITVDNPVPPIGDPSRQQDDPANVYMVTLRVRATLHSTLNPELEGLKGEARRGVHIKRDADLVKGFPINLRASGEASPKLFDLNGDKKDELIVADAAGWVHAFTADGTELPGWPAHVDRLPYTDDVGSKLGKGHATAPAFSGTTPRISPLVYSPVTATPAVGDIDGDGKPEVVVGSWYGWVFAFAPDGSVKPGFPVGMVRDSPETSTSTRYLLEDGFFAALALADLDKDERLEIIAGGMDGRLYAWTGSGQATPGFPVVMSDPSMPNDPKASEPQQRGRIMSSPAIGDFNKDGIPDIVLGTNENYTNSARLYIVDGRGNNAPGGPFLPKWPIQIVSNRVLPVVGEGLPNAPALADFDGDKIPEIMVSGIGSNLRVYGVDGKPFTKVRIPDNQRERYGAKSKANDAISIVLISNGSLGDIDDDGVIDIVHGTAGGDAPLAFASGGVRRDFEMHTSAWDSKTGKYKPGYPTLIEDWQFFMNPIIADVDGNGRTDVVNASAGYFIHAWDVDGVEAKGFPKFTGGWIASSPALGDMDGDGKMEIAVNTRNGWLFAWHIGGKMTGRVDWASFHHDVRNTGNYDAELDFGRRASPGCSMVGSSSASGIAFLLGLAAIGAAGWRRSRRRSP